jgi:hypothetical protein
LSHLKFFKKKCYAVIAYSPKGVTLGEANNALNGFISDRSRGLVLFHDHFVGRSGGIAIFYVDSDEEFQHLHNLGSLKEWEIEIFPLTFAESPTEFLYQIDFTIGSYRGKRLADLYKEYAQSNYLKNLDQFLKK